MSPRVRPALLTLFLLLGAATPGAAEIYRWVDERGVPHYAEGLDSVPERYRAAAKPTGFRNAPASAEAPATSPGRPGASGATEIRFTPGERIMVDARINGTTSARLLLDTGADRTLISPRVLAAAGVSLTRGTTTGTVTGVGGSAQIAAVPVESIQVGEARVDRLLVVSHDIGQGMDGLLGRDFLDQFRLTVDSAQGVATLAPKGAAPSGPSAAPGPGAAPAPSEGAPRPEGAAPK